MMISEWHGFRDSENACRNQHRYIDAALLGCRRQAGHWPAMPGVRRSCIADDEDVSKVGNRKVPLDLDAAGAVGIQALSHFAAGEATTPAAQSTDFE